MKVKLQGSSPYLAKDQAKSDRATCFIGRGSDRSSTHRYMLAWGALANKGEYTSEDIVFVSVNGKRADAVPLPITEMFYAISAGATFITDTPKDRERDYNEGERKLAQLLVKSGYVEVEAGKWISDLA